MPPSLFTTKKGMTPGEGSWHIPSTGCPALVMMGCRQEAGLACGVTLVAAEGPRANSGPTLAENPQRIQFLDEVVGMLIVLGKETEGHSCHGVVTPGPVQAAEEVTAFLGKERTIGVWLPLGTWTWHGEPQVLNTNPPGWQEPPKHKGTFLDPTSLPGTGISLSLKDMEIRCALG